MAFDSNPQAVYHGQGYPSLEVLATSTFDFGSGYTTANEFAVASANAAAPPDGDADELMVLEVGSQAQLAMFRRGAIPTTAVTGGTDTGTAANSLQFRIAGVTYSLAVGTGGHMVLGRSAPNGGADGTVMNIYRIR